MTRSATEARGRISRASNRAQHQAAPWIERLARAGYAAKGMLYLLIGLFALQAAVGWGGQLGDSRSALAALERGMFGTVLLWLIATGLVCLTLWQLFRAALDPENRSSERFGVATRIGYALSGVIHGMLAVWVFTHLLTGDGAAEGTDGEGTRGAIARALEWGLAGRLVIGAIGAGVLIFGIQQIVRAWRVDLEDELEMGRMSQQMRKTTRIVGRAGLAARGIVFGLIGWFTIMAAWAARTAEAGGWREAFEAVRGFGVVVLSVVAVGVVAYGVYMFILARYRRIRAE